MSVINPDEWQEFRRIHAEHPENTYGGQVLAVLCLLDLARYGIRWGAPEPEWVRCVKGAPGLRTVGRVYRVVGRSEQRFISVVADDGELWQFAPALFVPASADEATVTIDVPVAWAQWARDRNILKGWPGQDHEQRVRDACREALTKAGLL